MTAETATSPTDDIESVDETAQIIQEPVPGITISGVECQTKRLKTREFLKLMRIITDGMGGRLALMALSTDEEDEQLLAGQMLGALLNSIPYAEDAVIGFVQAMVEPVSDNPKDMKVVRSALENPEMEDLVAVITHIIDQEISELVSLGKAFGAWWQSTAVKDTFKTTP